MNAKDAADLVRYCRDSLDINVNYWEIGNEIHHSARWKESWTAENPKKYYFGGSDERRGKFNHGVLGTLFKGDLFQSDGTPNQRWLIHFPDVKPGSDSVWVGPDSTNLVQWTRVENLDSVGVGNYYEMDYNNSILIFGDGINGDIPNSEYGILCEYTTTNHDGFIAFVDSMKAVDPTIKIGTPFSPDTTWSTDTLNTIFSHTDFVIMHHYNSENTLRYNSYYERMTYAHRIKLLLTGTRAWLDNWASVYSDNISIGLTEWNFLGVKGAHANEAIGNATLASALFAAEQIGFLIQHSNITGLKIANLHALVWRHTPNYHTPIRFNNHLRRPVFYVFKMFKHYFGDLLVKNTTKSDSFEVDNNYYSYLTSFSAIKDDNLFLIVVNKDSSEAHTTQIELLDFVPKSNGIIHVLNGDSVYSTNENDSTAVIIKDSLITNVSNSFSYTFPAHSVTALVLTKAGTGIKKNQSSITTYKLGNAYPNPFNATTNIRYQLPVKADVRMEIYNIMGQKVRTLVDEMQNPGRYSKYWHGKNDKGESVSSGIYFYQLNIADNFCQTKKLLLLK